jgi:hypothetical protein
MITMRILQFIERFMFAETDDRAIAILEDSLDGT